MIALHRIEFSLPLLAAFATAALAQPAAVVRSSFVYQPDPVPSVHASTIAETRDGPLSGCIVRPAAAGAGAELDTIQLSVRGYPDRRLQAVGRSRQGKVFDIWSRMEYLDPTVIQSAAGLVRITYTWRRERLRHGGVDPARLGSEVQQLPPATQSIPIRKLATPEAATRDPLRSIVDFVPFSNGSLLVHEVESRRVLMFDSSMTRATIVADTTGRAPVMYPEFALMPQLFPFVGDSAALVDFASRAFLILGPDGAVARVMAHPRPSDLPALNLAAGGVRNATFDSRGRLVYRAAAGSRPIDDSTRRAVDTAAIVRADFVARTVDTVAFITYPPQGLPATYMGENGRGTYSLVINPVPPAPDEWAVLRDGSIAVVRGIDYHIDWRYNDDRLLSTRKMPFDWRRLTEADKLARIDTLKRMIDSINATGTAYGRITLFCTPGPRGEKEADRIARCLEERQAGRRATHIVDPTISFLPLDEIPDYVSAVRQGGIKADADNRLWILPTTTLSATGGGLLYDVVDKLGEIVERVQLPAGRNIAGFGSGGVVYLVAGTRATGFTIERTRVVRDDVSR